MSARSGRETLRAGFTLLEVVLATAVFAFLMAASYSFLTGMAAAKRVVDDARDVQDDAASVINRVVRELGKIQDVTLMKDPSAPSTVNSAFRGVGGGTDNSRRLDSFTFVASEAGQYVPGGMTNQGMVQITYRVEPDPKSATGLTLVREEIPHRTTTTPNVVTAAFAKRMVFPVTQNVLSFRGRYLDDARNEWQDEWGGVGLTKLPDVVEIRLRMASPSGSARTFTAAVMTFR